jgi:hypothetical protein
VGSSVGYVVCCKLHNRKVFSDVFTCQESAVDMKDKKQDLAVIGGES